MDLHCFVLQSPSKTERPALSVHILHNTETERSLLSLKMYIAELSRLQSALYVGYTIATTLFGVTTIQVSRSMNTIACFSLAPLRIATKVLYILPELQEGPPGYKIAGEIIYRILIPLFFLMKE